MSPLDFRTRVGEGEPADKWRSVPYLDLARTETYLLFNLCPGPGESLRLEEQVADEYAFRFVNVRAGDKRARLNQADKKIDLQDPTNVSEFAAALKSSYDGGASRESLLALVREYQESEEYVTSLEDLPFDVVKGLEWVSDHAEHLVKDLAFDDQLAALYGQKVARLTKRPNYNAAKSRLYDTLVAEALHPMRKVPPDRLVAACKWLGLIQLFSSGRTLDSEAPLGRVFAELQLALPAFNGLPSMPVPAVQDPSTANADESDSEDQDVRERMARLETAHAELSEAAVTDDALMKPPEAGDHVHFALQHLDHRLGLLEQTTNRGEVVPLPDAPPAPADGTRVRLNAEAISRLSEETKQAVNELRIDLTETDPKLAVEAIERVMQSTSVTMEQLPSQDLLFFGGARIDVDRATEALRRSLEGDSGVADTRPQCRLEAGVGELLMVRQTLKTYELADFAHVENVLAGESREREHRRLNVREEVLFEEEEQETERERNLESTDRNEMQAEAERTIREQFQLESGLQVSASYGPTVSFTARLEVGFSTTTEESQRKAVAYSRDVTEKAAERVRERIRRELRRRMVEQVEEVNRHAITNSPPTNGHVRGVYRWLNKVYEAHVVNYGLRMMFDMVVPEPSAYLLHAMVTGSDQGRRLTKPVAPNFLGVSLQPSHITRGTYLLYVSQYQVRNVPAPPPEFIDLAAFDKLDGDTVKLGLGRSGKIDIPAGYQAVAATVMADFSGDYTSCHFMMGGASTNFIGRGYPHNVQFGRRLQGAAGYAFHFRNARSFAFAINVHCRLTAQGLAKWQHEVYDSILEAYRDQLADYEGNVAALAIQQGPGDFGRNPSENRRMVVDELKKLAIMMLVRTPDIARNSMSPAAEPAIDVAAACRNARWIGFFERAFEWNNLTYVFYPYFWGRQARWASALQFADPDPEFAAFLKAGAARVQLPVRPGFEAAVAHFCQFGGVWEGDDVPLSDDNLYAPIVEELTDSLGKIEGGVPYPEGAEPWDVRLPTSLVLLQDADEIPGIRDVLTGNEVSL